MYLCKDKFAYDLRVFLILSEVIYMDTRIRTHAYSSVLLFEIFSLKLQAMQLAFGLEGMFFLRREYVVSDWGGGLWITHASLWIFTMILVKNKNVRLLAEKEGSRLV